MLPTVTDISELELKKPRVMWPSWLLRKFLILAFGMGKRNCASSFFPVRLYETLASMTTTYLMYSGSLVCWTATSLSCVFWRRHSHKMCYFLSPFNCSATSTQGWTTMKENPSNQTEWAQPLSKDKVREQQFYLWPEAYFYLQNVNIILNTTLVLSDGNTTHFWEHW